MYQSECVRALTEAAEEVGVGTGSVVETGPQVGVMVDGDAVWHAGVTLLAGRLLGVQGDFCTFNHNVAELKPLPPRQGV